MKKRMKNEYFWSLFRRLSFNKLSSFIYGIKNYLYSYFEQIDIEKLGLTKNYLYPKKIVQETLNNINTTKIMNITTHNTRTRLYKRKKNNTH